MNDGPTRPGSADRDGGSSSATDADFLDAVEAGDRNAVEAFVRSHAPWMLAVARRITRDRALAEDCVQEAFANAFNKLGAFERRASLKSWLHRIVANQALMKIRTRTRQREQPIDDLLPEFDANSCRIEEPWQKIMTPDEILERKDRRALILSKIAELPDDYRIVVLFRDIEEMTTREVAEALDLSEANVKVRLHRARAALKKLLEPVLRGEI